MIELTKKAKLDADFERLYKAHARDVYSYAYYRVGNHHDAEDLTEQTSFRPTGTSRAHSGRRRAGRYGHG